MSSHGGKVTVTAYSAVELEVNTVALWAADGAAPYTKRVVAGAAMSVLGGGVVEDCVLVAPNIYRISLCIWGQSLIRVGAGVAFTRGTHDMRFMADASGHATPAGAKDTAIGFILNINDSAITAACLVPCVVGPFSRPSA